MSPDPSVLNGAHERDRDRTYITEDDKLTDPLLNLLTFKKKDRSDLNEAA